MAYSNAYSGGGFGDSLPPVPVRLASVKGEKNGAGSDGKKKRWFKGGGSSNPGVCGVWCVCFAMNVG